MDIEITCPLGHKCEEIRDNKVCRCAWYTQIEGTDPLGNRVDEWKCAIAWQPILMIEVSGTNRGQTQAIESLRNETIKRQDAALSQLRGAHEKIESK